MGFFSSEQKEISDEIVEEILSQQDRVKTILEVFSKLPSDLVEWITNTLKVQGKSKAYSEADLATIISSTICLPGDIIIRKNRDPKIGDIVEVAQRLDDAYHIVTVKILKINVKDSTAYVQNIIDSDSKGLIAIGSIISVIDSIIEFNTPEWKKLVQILDMDYDKEEIAGWVRSNIDAVKKSEQFHDKENNLKKLQVRLKELQQK